MKKILNWIVVIIVVFIITGLVCRAKIYDGMTEIKHIYNGMTPIYSIYDGPGVVTGASNITFQSIYNAFFYQLNPPLGSASISNNNLTGLGYYPSTYQSESLRSKYIVSLANNFIKLKYPISISIDSTNYTLSYYSIATNYTNYETNVISLNNRVSATSLTKTIDFDLVDNEQVTLVSLSGYFRAPNTNTVRINYYTSDVNLGAGFTTRRRWVFSYTGSKTPRYIVLNGRLFTVSRDNRVNSLYYTNTMTETAFQASSSNLSWGQNIRFTDGTYLNNTRSKLFTRTRASQIYRRPVVPVITSFSVTPTTIDLDDRLTGTISFSLGVTGTSGQVTTARIIRVRDNAQIGTTFTGGSGLNLSQTLPNIAQPLRTETYRLIATNTDGNSHMDTTVTVTKNPTLTNCRRTNYIDATTLYEFAFNLTGLPRPSVRYVFTQNNIAGQQGQVPYSHYAQGSNPYTWSVTGWRINFANSNARTLRLTASNSSGSSSCVINNIND